jgi:hypothetical protein
MSEVKGKIRHFKLANKGAFVARMQIIWTFNDGKGTVGQGTYDPIGYHDICAGGEREIDLKDTGIPNGSTVQLRVDVVLGKDKKTEELFEYDSSCESVAEYKISGTTLSSKLSLDSYGE